MPHFIKKNNKVLASTEKSVMSIASEVKKNPKSANDFATIKNLQNIWDNSSPKPDDTFDTFTAKRYKEVCDKYGYEYVNG